MTVSLADLKLYLHVDYDDEDATLDGLLAAAQKHIEGQLGFTFEAALDDEREGFEDGVPADLDQALMQLVAQWFANREIVGEIAQPLPFGVAEIIANHRTYTFG